MIVVLGGLVVLDLIVGGFTLNRDFIAKASVLGDYTVSARITYNIAPILLSAFGDESDVVRTIAAGGFTALTPLWMKVISTSALLGLSALLLVRVRRIPMESRILVLTVGLALIIALAGPFGWSHYFLLPSLLLPALLQRGQTRYAKAMFVIVLLAASSPTIFLPSLALAQNLPFVAFSLLLWVVASGPAAKIDTRDPLRPLVP